MIIGIVNQKGGCGKTTLATNLACLSAINKKNTLLIDADIQGSSVKFRAIRPDKRPQFRAVSILTPTIHKDINSFNFDAAFSKASSHSTCRKTSPTRTCDVANRSPPLRNSGIANRPSTHAGTLSFTACAVTSLLFVVPSVKAHAWSQKIQVDSVTLSGLPCHLAYRSAKLPVGHTSTHEPQN